MSHTFSDSLMYGAKLPYFFVQKLNVTNMAYSSEYEEPNELQ